MLAADPIITDLSTWDATTWIAALAALIALGALVTAVFARSDSRRASDAGVKSAGAAERSATASERSATTGEASALAAQRSADAAEAANALLTQEAERRESDRHDAAGPRFAIDDAEVVEGPKVWSPLTEPEPPARGPIFAAVVMRMEGGPGALRVDVRPAGVPWCAGVSVQPENEPAASVLFPPIEPGDVVRFVVHLTTHPWAGHLRIMLPLSVTATSATDETIYWERREQVPLVPGPAAPRRLR